MLCGTFNVAQQVCNKWKRVEFVIYPTRPAMQAGQLAMPTVALVALAVGSREADSTTARVAVLSVIVTLRTVLTRTVRRTVVHVC